MKSDRKVSEIKRKKRKLFKAFSLDIKILNLDFKVYFERLRNWEFTDLKKRIKNWEF